MPDSFLRLNTTALCYDFNAATNKIPLLFDGSRLSGDRIELLSVSNRVLDVRLNEDYLSVNSSEMFEKIEVRIELGLFVENENKSFLFLNQFEYSKCTVVNENITIQASTIQASTIQSSTIQSSTIAITATNPGETPLSGDVIAAIVIGSIAGLLIVGLIIIFLIKKIFIKRNV